jgi:hypothetical protein
LRILKYILSLVVVVVFEERVSFIRNANKLAHTAFFVRGLPLPQVCTRPAQPSSPLAVWSRVKPPSATCSAIECCCDAATCNPPINPACASSAPRNDWVAHRCRPAPAAKCPGLLRTLRRRPPPGTPTHWSSLLAVRNRAPKP